MNVHVSALTKNSTAEAATAPDDKVDGSTASAFALDVLAGLGRQPKQLSPKYFYDLAGSDLFEQISHRDELKGVPFDRRQAAEALKLYLGD